MTIVQERKLLKKKTLCFILSEEIIIIAGLLFGTVFVSAAVIVAGESRDLQQKM